MRRSGLAPRPKLRAVLKNGSRIAGLRRRTAGLKSAALARDYEAELYLKDLQIARLRDELADMTYKALAAAALVPNETLCGSLQDMHERVKRLLATADETPAAPHETVEWLRRQLRMREAECHVMRAKLAAADVATACICDDHQGTHLRCPVHGTTDVANDART